MINLARTFSVIFSVLVISMSTFAKPWLALDLNSWTTLKEMCENYRDFGAQIPPEDIQVKCESTVLRTQVVGKQELVFPSTGSITMSISSSKAKVNTNMASTAVQPVKVHCPTVAQVRQISAGSFPVTCDELKSYDKSFADFCTDKLSSGDYTEEAEIISGTEKSLCNKKP